MDRDFHPPKNWAAQERYLTTPEDRLRFLVFLATCDLSRRSSAEWGRLRGQLAEFLWGGEQRGAAGVVTATSFEPPEPLRYPPAAFHALQGELQALLEGLVDRDHVGLLRMQLHRPPRLELLPGAGARMVLAITRVPVRDAVVFQLALLLSRTPSGRLRRCPEERCGHRLYYAYKGRKHCSDACRDRRKHREKRREDFREAQRVRQARSTRRSS